MHDSKIQELEYRHRNLEREIAAIESQPNHNTFRVQELKKHKLAVKDELTRLRKEDYDERQRVNFDDEDY